MRREPAVDEPVREPFDQPVREPVADQVAPGKCDALYDEYVLARSRAERWWSLALFVSWAAAVLIVVAVMMIFLDYLGTEAAAGGVALFSSLAAGAIVTNAVNASKTATEALDKFVKECPNAASRLAALAA
jgi:hypothetical protein